MVLFVALSNLENFIRGGALFFITLVSCPENITTPSKYSVFLIYIPLKITFSESKDIDWVYFSGKLRFPSNLYRYGFGFSQVSDPAILDQILGSFPWKCFLMSF